MFRPVFRYLNSLYRLANKHPFWGARKLSETLHADMMTALSDRPVGFRFRVRYLTHLELSLIMSSHVLQMPPRPSGRQTRRLLLKLGFHSVTTAKKPLLSWVNQKKRKEYARKHRQHNWSKVILRTRRFSACVPGAT